MWSSNILVQTHFVMDQWHTQTTDMIAASLWTALSNNAKDES